MDLRKLKTLIELVEHSGISELEVTEGEEKVRIVKHPPAPPASTYLMAPPVAAPVPLPGGVAPPAVAPPGTATKPESAPPAGFVVKAPMVGTFYRAGAPGANAYVEIGSQVKDGDVLCIIEAMKLMNEIPAEASGTITQILAENGQPVEYGQPLFVIE
ncbi:MAG: acetyl-CoA carboxylase biotin carboxyl carrier protein [Burkholderiales bacterium]|nr:acetyl-CoA carboxylase biotin carboxyl carrier protein [Burkholderiales bacterium]